jgi:hypothetical protein
MKASATSVPPAWTPSEGDRASLALWKQDMERIREGAEIEMKKRMKRMTADERTKFKRLLKNIEYLGDVGKAAGKSRVSRKLLDKWMNTRGVSWHINTARNKAQFMLHSGSTAEDVLFRAKTAPQLEIDGEFFRETGQRHRESKVIAKLAAKDLKGWRWDIAQAARNNDKYFFIDLGCILSGELSGDLHDKLDADIAEICIVNPGISTRDALVELEKRGHKSLKEHTIRTRKKRLGLTRQQNRKL